MPEAPRHPIRPISESGHYLEAAIRQIRQLSCILDSCTISASYEVSQAQKALLLLPHTAKGASTSSEELNAQDITTQMINIICQLDGGKTNSKSINGSKSTLEAFPVHRIWQEITQEQDDRKKHLSGL